jgi:hypothetical protein
MVVDARANTTVNVTRWKEVNYYGYDPIGLFLPYALGILFAFSVVVLGGVSYARHGIFPGKTFQDIATAADCIRVEKRPESWGFVTTRGVARMTQD